MYAQVLDEQDMNTLETCGSSGIIMDAMLMESL